MPRSRSLVPLLSMAVLAFVAASSGSAQLAQPPTGSGHGQKALTWTAPSEWTKEKPSSPLRRGQYRIPGPGGPAECTVFYFGPGQGGDAESNIERWISQFRRADGSPASNAAKKRQITVGALPVALVEVQGTFVGGAGPMAVREARPNYMLLGAVAEGPDANWFFRAIGPRDTLERQREAFERLVSSIKPGQ